MSLLDRAIAFTQDDRTEDQAALLLECVRTGGVEALAAVQRMYEDMYGDITYNMELKRLPAHTLICWGEAGLDALVEAARRTDTPKNRSLTLLVLSALAAGERPLLIATETSELGSLIHQCLRDIDFRDSAKRKLANYILSLPDDDVAAQSIGMALQFLSYLSGTAPRHLFAALAARWLAVSQTTITEYERLLETASDDEATFQQFFERFPQLLDPMAYQVWPQPDLHGFKEPDFVIRRTDNSYLIVEIETPAKALVTGALQMSAQATQAITQAMQYRTFLMERFKEAADHFPSFQTPECLVVIGLERDLSDEQRRALLMENQHRQGVRIVGFDWIARRAAAVTQNIVETGVDVRPLRMI
jgi:hypothetical protein